ncbi:MAG: hypothetical protein N2247_04205 [Leptospiraceae bacterium]|jgi:uncharacterized membrane protein (DUF485 family)|nr:hypothetical protein [Leptospiraceae bacterium]
MMAWLYIILLFFILLALIYVRYKNKEFDPFGNLSISKNEKNSTEVKNDSN